jgi:small-conductance mechanosensitive channel
MWDWIIEQAGSRWFQTILLVLGLLIARALVLRIVHRRLPEPEDWYRARKVASYLTTVVGAIGLGRIWLDAFSDLATFLGLLSAGVAIALADVLKNLAGWAFIILRRPFRVGDRIEIEETMGDVIDVRAFRFTVVETGNWVDADQSTGRLVHIPNGTVITRPVANYTEGFPFIWHEIAVLITFESDWELGERLLQEALDAECPDIADEAARQIRLTGQKYQIRFTQLRPTVYVTVKDSGVLLTARFLVPARARRGFDQAVWKAFLRAIADDPRVELAYPTNRTVFTSIEAQPPFSTT